MSDAPLIQALKNLSPEKRAMLAKMLQADSSEPASSALPEGPLAIIGMGCRFPGGANSLEKYWQLLQSGRDAVTTIPQERWPVETFYDPDPAAPGKINSPYGAFLDQVDQFDAAFFGISPREAVRMDPQQRLLLEVAWEALENAGQSQHRLAGSNTGVFVGIYQSDYSWRQYADVGKVDAYVASGMSHAIAANRISFLFDLRGPSLATDTACSSSLVAFHLACQSLRQQECDMAIVAGVNLMLSPLSVLPIAKWGMMAPDGRCKTFDAAADGFGRGEGCGVLIVKRLADAQRDGDPILALCRSSAVNQDGRTNVLTAPNGLAQRSVIAQALESAQLEGEQVSYIEAHGTGTALGDPIEMEALIETIGRRPAGKPCFIGSVKTNIGHLEAAAGVAGLIKTVLALQHRMIPANLHFKQLNPHIELGDVPFILPATSQPWPKTGDEPRRAGISAFGFGGTNAHVILEEAPPVAARTNVPNASQAEAELLVLSVPQPSALPALANAYGEMLTSVNSLAEICRSAAQRRTHFNHRMAVVGRSTREMVETLEGYLLGDVKPPLLHRGRRTPGLGDTLVFVYGGQGAQWLGMGRQLLNMVENAAANRIISSGLHLFVSELRYYDMLFQNSGLPSIISELRAPNESGRLQETTIAQPAIFSVQMALTALWRTWGFQPAAVVGHSLGEVSAAVASGSLTPEDAVFLVATRSRLMQSITGLGKMAAIRRPAVDVESYLESFPGLAIAAINGPQETVVAGLADQLAALLATLEATGAHCQYLPVDYAFHSPQTIPLARQLVVELQAARFHPRTGNVPFVSSVNGDYIPGEKLDAAYWGQNMSQPVRFGAAIDLLISGGHLAFLEISPHPVLVHYIESGLSAAGQQGVVASSLRRNRDEYLTLLNNLGRLYVAGFDPDWTAIFEDSEPRRVTADRPVASFVQLPNYPWQRRRYWLEAPPVSSTPSDRLPDDHGRSGRHPLLGHIIRSPLINGIVFETPFSGQSPSFQGDHRIYDTLVVPATAFLEMASAAAKAVFGPGSHRLQQTFIRDALLIPEQGQVILQLAINDLQPDGPDMGQPAKATFQIYASLASENGSHGLENWKLYVRGRMRAEETAVEMPMVDFDPDLIRARCPEELDGRSYYERGRDLGGQLGQRFLSIDHLWRSAGADRPGEALGRLMVNRLLHDEWNGYTLHPAFMDAAFHIAYAAQSDEMAQLGVLMPVSFDEVCYYRAPANFAEPIWCHFRLRPEGDSRTPFGDVSLYDASGSLLATVNGIRYLRAASDQIKADKETFSASGALSSSKRPAADDQSPDTHPAMPGGGPLAHWLYEVTWRPSKLGASSQGGDQPGRGWLIFDNGDQGQALANLLRERGHPAMVEHPTPADPARYLEMFANCTSQMPDGFDLIYMASSWPKTSDDDSAVDRGPKNPEEQAGEIADDAKDELLAALHLAQAALRFGGVIPPQLWLVTRQAVVTEPAPFSRASGTAEKPMPSHSSAVNLLAAPLWGFGRTLALEHPQQWGGLIDLEDLPAAEATVLLAAELLQPDGEQQIAWRDGQRLVARLTAHKPSEIVAPALLPIRPDATYLITGASGGIGRELVQWLVEQGARHLALWSRNKPNWLDTDNRPLEAIDPDVGFFFQQVNLGQPEQVVTAWEHLQADQPAIRGIFHAAGVVSDGAILGLTAERFSEVLPAKINGSWQLHRLTTRLAEPLDFMIFFSSGAAVLGSPGQSNYAAANQFMDSLGHYRRLLGLPALSINWGPWNVGMSTATGAQGKRRWQAWGLEEMDGQRAGMVLSYLLAQPTAQIAVLPFDNSQALTERARPTAALFDPLRQPFFQELLAANGQHTSLTIPSPGQFQQMPTPVGSTLRRQLENVPLRQRQRILLEFLQEHIRLVLGWDSSFELDLQQGLFDIGFDSLTAVELKERLDVALDLEQPLPVTLAFDYPTLTDLIEYLLVRIAPSPLVADRAESSPAATTGNGAVEDGLEELSEDELAALLATELGASEDIDKS